MSGNDAVRDHSGEGVDDHGSHPPGTVQLLTSYSSTRGGELVLIPTPSDDYNDPLNWSMWRKCLSFGLLNSVTVATFTALSTLTIFWTQMQEEIDLSTQDFTYAQAIQLVGQACTCLFLLPIIRKYGRRPTCIVSSVIVCACSWWSVYMKSVPEVYLYNFFMGVAAEVNEATVQLSMEQIQSTFFLHQRGTTNSIYMASVLAGSFLTPMAAGVQAVDQGWRRSYLTLAVVMTVLAVLFLVIFEETKFEAPVLRGTAPGDGEAAHHGELAVDEKDGVSVQEDGEPRRAKPSFPRYLRLQFCSATDESLWRSYYQPVYACWLPHVIFASLQFASGVCWLVFMSSMISILFTAPPYNFDAAEVGFMFAGPCVGAVLGSLYGGPLVDKAVVWFARRNGGLFEPEMRLYLYPLPALLMSGGIVLFGVTADRGLHWIYPSIGGAFFSFGYGAVGDIAFTLVLDAFPNVFAQSFVCIAFFRNAVGITGPFSITPWLDAMSVTNMHILAGCLCIFINALALPLAIWGKKARIATAPRYNQVSRRLAEE
ncbi:G protein-coupled receptor GPR1 [Purpureocillium lavendulum]|uniref:G protein-coupled receptor GPR1 n=1 Tax=Purpureocillium lavendulum TaxID=1247861 RepID=A0AB34G284_9HYPO|nr:G protein-coupled receptor GPR1 [Purpureocillium lavendulum]